MSPKYSTWIWKNQHLLGWSLRLPSFPKHLLQMMHVFSWVRLKLMMQLILHLLRPKPVTIWSMTLWNSIWVFFKLQKLPLVQTIFPMKINSPKCHKMKTCYSDSFQIGKCVFFGYIVYFGGTFFFISSSIL
jgi:hypothetical protein